MKKCLSLLLLFATLLTVVPLSASAAAKNDFVHKKMSWKTLNAAATMDEPYTDYESVYDKTKEIYPFAEFEEDLFTLRDRFPDRMKLEVIGYSELGRPLYAVVMGSDSAPNRFLLIAGAHGREYIGTQLNVLQIEFYLQNYYNTIEGERICDLMERCQFYFIPALNPDGEQLTMTGLDSLDDPSVTIDAAEKAEIEKFLLSQVEDLNWTAEIDLLMHDTDAVLYSENPDPERDDAFQYWKTNIRGVDVHYNMYDAWMMDIWKRGKWYYRNQKDYFTAPNWFAYTGIDEDDGIATSENIALKAYMDKVQPNIFISYHAAGGIVQWSYGYNNIAGGQDLKANAQQIAFKCGSLTGYPVDAQENSPVGHVGWYNHYSQSYMDTAGFGVVIELAKRDYLDYVGDRQSYNDTPPVQSIQLFEDVKNKSGLEKFSIWKTCKFLPIGMTQFILDNQLIEAVGPLNGDPNAPIQVTSILGNAVTEPAAADVLDFGTFQLPRAGKTAVIPGDILTNDLTPVLYNADFSEAQHSVEINGTTPVYFAYTNSEGKEVRATFKAEPLAPVTAVAGAEVTADTTDGDSSSASAPAALKTASGAVTLAAHQAALAPADFTAAAGYTVSLYTDEAYTAAAETFALAEGENTVYVKVTGTAGDSAYYILQVVNPEAPPAPVEPAPAAGISPAVIGIGAAAVVLAAVIGIVVSKKRKKA